MSEGKPIGYWLKLVDRLIDEQFAATLDEHGVTRRQWQLLNVLANGDATLSELDVAVAPFLNPDAQESSAEHLAELVESSWVTLSASGYSITEQGSGALAGLSEVVTRNHETLAVGVEQVEFDAALVVLERMARNLGWSE